MSSFRSTTTTATHTRPPRSRVVACILAVMATLVGGAIAMPSGAQAAGVAAGGEQSCAIKAGNVWCWGSTWVGLGDGTSTTSATPVLVQGLSDAAEVAVGDGHACARRADQTVWCWGDNGDGQLGNGTTTDAPTPVPVVGIGDAVAISTGDRHSCAVRSGGQIACWGDNGDGQLGDGTTTSRSAPVPVSGIGDARAVSGGAAHTCAVLRSGTVRCWGSNADDQLGDGTAVGNRLVPSADLPGLSDAVAVAAGDEHSCALRASGAIACWGDNWNGQLGDGTTDDRATPTAVPGLTDVAALSVGASFTCAVVRGGGSRCWGSDDSGQIGAEATSATTTTPVPVPGVGGAVGIASGAEHTCAASAAGAVQCWGNGAGGQLGNGKTDVSAAPTAVGGLQAVRGIGVGAETSCAVEAAGTVRCWGRGRYGDLGDGTNAPAPRPVPVTGVSDATLLASGGTHHCAVLGSGNDLGRMIRCWGSNWAGQLGNGGTQAQNVATPVDLTGPHAASPGGRFAALTAGNDHTCALSAPDGNTYGSVWCWGRGGYGQLGNGQIVDASVPQQTDRPAQLMFVASQANGPTIAAGDQHTCVVSSSQGHVWCWGSNFYGQIGDRDGQTGHDQHRPVPKQVAKLEGAVNVPLTNVRSLAAGANHSCALRNDGTVTCWGSGARGQLGNGQTPASSRPVEVPIAGVVALHAGGDRTCATRADGSVTCWGARFDGHPPANQSIPTALPGVSAVAAMAIGEHHACATGTDATVTCWGRGTYGQLGDGPMPAGHYPLQRTPSYVVGFAPPVPPSPQPPPDTTPPPTPGPVPPTPPTTTRALTRPKLPTVELRDGTLSLRGLTLKRAKGTTACPKTAKATVTGRVGRRTLRTVATVRLAKSKTSCRTTARVKLRGRLADAQRVTLTIASRGLATSRRAVTARFTTRLQAAAIRLDRLVVRSTRGDDCPSQATVVVTGATTSTRKHRVTRKNVPVRLAPTAHCQITATVRLSRELRRSRAVTVTVQGTGLSKVTRTVRAR